MTVTVNGVEVTDADMEVELAFHEGAGNPVDEAMITLVLKRVLLDEAARLGIGGGNDEAVIDALLEREVQVPEADEATCRRYYDSNPDRFTVGELVEADHILFQVTPGVSLDALRERAQAALNTVLGDISCFGDIARTLSNCPSGSLGGNLGQLGRGDTVPEFERVVFGLKEGEVLSRLLETRFGLHIVRVRRHVAGRLRPYDDVRDDIAAVLAAASRDTAWRQYASYLAGQADIHGYELEGADSPLLQ
ncbi:peptidylprolyl isomerase [Pusillimonas sp. ANT_WB101]|uniref:peptidylprolyl isomerase n=1 Tax=Pusillimonas sp. ANT_WB101 TaxID=2597356 RepID=UPI0011ECA6D8|nr:peptidylprolyl isomerase [Pusillimonas sp. ANT_WB101]KAA0893002.1 peptidylprolyl isomerase [Pusillimonas sp. ANT_WB101]